MKHRYPTSLSAEEKQLTLQVLARIEAKSERSYWGPAQIRDEQEWERMQIESARREAERRRSA